MAKAVDNPLGRPTHRRTSTPTIVPIGRRASFDEVEKFCLRALLLDNNNDKMSSKQHPSEIPQSATNAKPKGEHDTREKKLECIDNVTPRPSPPDYEHKQKNSNQHPLTTNSDDNTSDQKALNERVLFQIPFDNRTVYGNNNMGDNISRIKNYSSTSSLQSGNRPTTEFGRHEKKILGLWQAYDDGTHPIVMQRLRDRGHLRKTSSGVSSLNFANAARSRCGTDDDTMNSSQNAAAASASASTSASTSALASSVSVHTDREVRPTSSNIVREDDLSWGDEEGGFLHYDAWEVLKDEYAEDFGFDFKETRQSISATLREEDEDIQGHVFEILGTSADDVSSQPHVLSPPLMDSLLNFLPDTISNENYWMRFSLIRDGASLYTLKNYIKAARYTLLAIETTKGHVFGAFTSHTWRNHPTFFGQPPAFLWRMRHNRRTPVHSLYEQAQLESEIDVYAYSGLNDLFQVCDEYRIAIGGGKLIPDWATAHVGFDTGSPDDYAALAGIDVESLERGENFGFGLSLDEDLRSGTTSPCGTFRNPCLINNLSKGEMFEVANLEVWSFTPCSDTNAAERMEMTRYFMEESIRNTSLHSEKSGSTQYSNPFSSQEEFQADFYRRVGQQPSDDKRNSSYEYRHLVAGYR